MIETNSGSRVIRFFVIISIIFVLASCAKGKLNSSFFPMDENKYNIKMSAWEYDFSREFIKKSWYEKADELCNGNYKVKRIESEEIPGGRFGNLHLSIEGEITCD